MKRRFIAFIGCLLALAMLSGGALAETSYAGKIAAGETVRIQAPFTAAVERVGAETGDYVHSGDILFELATNKVYAPCDGTVQGVLAQEGDRLEDLALFYQGAIYIEPQVKNIIRAAAEIASSEKENKILHIGETVYLRRSSDSDRRTGTGRITELNGNGFTVEVLSGDLILDDSCYIYRSASYDYESRIGRGTVARNEPIAVNGTGTVLKLYAEDGQTVQKGDLLMETAPANAAAESVICAPVDGILASSSVTLGATLSESQLAMEIWQQGAFIIQLNVDEYELPKFELGQKYTAALDCKPTSKYEATVAEIGYYPVQETGSAQYIVKFSFDNDDFVRPGMSVTLTRAEG